jgi:hypothetical protein
MTLPSKECHELRDAFQFILIWKDSFHSKYGDLVALSHLSNPDDPPDVIAHFRNRDISIEVTTIDPPHIRQCDDLHNKVGEGSGRAVMPLTINPGSRQEALEMMYVPGSSPRENVPDRNQVWFDLISERVAKKIGNARVKEISSGILLLPGDIDGSLGEDIAVKEAFASIRRSIPESAGWTLAVCSQWNNVHHFSAIDSPETGFEVKQSQS